MKGRSLFPIALALVLTTTSRTQSPSTSAPDFQADTQEVLVDAVVTDKKGNISRDLTAQDFKIFEDGKEQKITSFTVAGHAGRHFLALVFDEDQSTFRAEALRFVDQFRSPDLYIAIYARTNEEIRLIQAFTTDPLKLRSALRDMRIVGETQSIRFTPGSAPEVPMLDRIDKVASELKPIHGRKALVLFTGEHLAVSWAGGAAPTDRQFLRTIDNCNKASVAIYSFNIDASVASAADWYRGGASGKTTNRIRDLADRTGGKYGTPGSNQLSSYLGAIATQSDYYLLGYTPSTESATNCHKLKVTVARKDLDIDARDAYCAAFKAPAQTSAVGAAPMTMQATWFYLKRGTALVNVAMESNEKLGVALRADGSVAARFNGNSVKLPPGSYRIRAGNSEQSIEIPAWGGETLTASDIALGDHEIPSESVTINLDPTLFDGPYRLASREREFIPMETTQFHEKQQGLLYFEIYEPGPKVPVIELSIVDRPKGEQKFNSGPIETTQWTSPGSTRIPIAMPFPVADLPAGNYTLELRINNQTVRTKDFEVK